MGTREKTGGRTKGTPNKDTAEIRANFQLLIESNLKQIAADIAALPPYERIKVILELSKFILPTLKATDLNIGNNEVIEISFKD